MHPALSVIFFTTLSGAGYGMLMWLGVLLVIDYSSDGPPVAAPLFLAVSLCVASVLVAVGLSSSMLHLGKPGRAWRAFSQWRTSWLSREGVMSLVTYLPVLALVALIGTGIGRAAPSTANAPLVPALAVTLVACALLTVVCTAMIYGSLKTIPAWRHRLVPLGYVSFALLTGGAVLAAMAAFAGVGDAAARVFAVAIVALALVTVALKVACWRAIDTLSFPATRGDAVCMPGREVSVFERPHTEESYVTREMAFAVARKHAGRLRTIALLLFGLIPVCAGIVVWRVPVVAGIAFVAAGLSVLAGTFIERWLFFAEARHVVTLYY